MELDDPQVRNILLDESDDFRGLVKEHAGFESRLEELTGKQLPSEQERIEETQLKKHKLILKDQMAALMRDYRDKLVVAH